MTCMFDQAVLLFGEIGCGSLLGLKRLRESLFDSLIVVSFSSSKWQCPRVNIVASRRFLLTAPWCPILEPTMEVKSVGTFPVILLN